MVLLTNVCYIPTFWLALLEFRPVNFISCLYMPWVGPSAQSALKVSKPRRLIPTQRIRYFTAGKITMFRPRYVHYLLLCCWNFFFPSSIVRDKKTFQHTCVVNENEAACMGRHQLFPGLRSMNRWAELVVIQKGFFFLRCEDLKDFLRGKKPWLLLGDPILMLASWYEQSCG